MSGPIDIMLFGLPVMSPLRPAPAPALLKAQVERVGFKAKAIDLNFQLWKESREGATSYEEICNYLKVDEKYIRIKKAVLNGEEKNPSWSSPDIDEILDKFIDRWAEKIFVENPNYVGVSVFSYDSIIFALKFLAKIKEMVPKVKVVVGGAGVFEYNFSLLVQSLGLCDYLIEGEGEEQLVNLMLGDTSSFVRGKQIEDLNSISFPDYTDYECLRDRIDGFQPVITLTGSRGCVRRCKFCDVNFHWPKFRYRSAESLVDEIEWYWKALGQKRFFFSDSLINGSKRNLIATCRQILKRIEVGRLPEALEFSGQVICPRKELYSFEDYKIIAAAGFKHVSIGVESGSDKVLREMGKQFNIEDLTYMLSMLRNSGIRADLMFLVGFPTESDEDFDLTIRLLDDLQEYSNDGTILALTLGKTMGVLAGSEVGRQRDQWGIMYDSEGNWYSTLNKTLTLRNRLERRLRLQLKAEELGYRVRGALPGYQFLNHCLQGEFND